MQTPEAWASPAYPDSTAPVFSGPECSWLDSLTESSPNQADFQVLLLASGSRDENIWIEHWNLTGVCLTLLRQGNPVTWGQAQD